MCMLLSILFFYNYIYKIVEIAAIISDISSVVLSTLCYIATLLQAR